MLQAMKYALVVALAAGLLVSCSQAPPNAPAGQAPAQTGEKRFQSLGLGGGGGLFSPIGSPHDPKLCFVSCDMGGFYRSTDGGQSWRMYDERMVGGSTVCRPAFHPTDPTVIYMPGRGLLLVSRNRGETFEPLLQTSPWGREQIMAINLDQGNGDVLFVGTGNGLWRSSDGGKTFAACTGVSGSVIWTHVDRTSPKDARVVLCGSDSGVYRSTDGGGTWQKLQHVNLPAKLNGFAAGSDANTVVCYATDDQGVYASADRGATWVKCATGLPGARKYAFACMAQTVPNTCYVTDDDRRWGVYKTTDGGKTWRNVFRFFTDEPGQNVTWGWLATDVAPAWGGPAIGFGVNPGNPDYAMYTNTGELFMTDNGGEQWRWGCSKSVGALRKGAAWQPIGLEVTTCWNYVFDPFEKNTAFICYTDIGFARTNDAGKTWYYAANSFWNNTTYRCIPDPAKPGVFFSAVANHHDIPGWGQIEGPRGGGGVVMSTDHCKTWQRISEGLPARLPCVSIELDTKSNPDSRTLYASMFGDGVYKSTDGGKSWNRASEGLGEAGNRHVYALSLQPDGTLYCLITGKRVDLVFGPPGALYKSTDGAKTWTNVTKGLTVYWPTEYLVDSQDPNSIWLSGADVPQFSTGGLYHTADGGATWKAVLTNKDFDQTLSTYVHCFAIAQHPVRKNVMYLSTWTHGPQISTDSGKTWKPLMGIPFITTNRISFDPQDPDVTYWTTYGGGVWKGPWNGY